METRNSGIIVLAAIAALVASFCDKVHVITNTLYYPKPAWGGQPWWTFPGFFVVFVFMCAVYLLMEKQLPHSIDKSYSTKKGSAQQFIESLLLFAFVYLMSGFGNEWPILLNVLFYGTFLLRWLASRDKTFILIISLILAVGGTLGEGVLSAMGLVYYTKPVIFHVPLWLGGVYMHGAFALRDSMRFFVYTK